jgi:hypothetical protein
VSTVTDTTTAALTKDAITFTVTFSEALVGTVGTSNFTATNGTVSSVTQVGSSSTYTVVVNPTTGVASGIVALSLVRTGLSDAAGNSVTNADLSAKDSQGIDTLSPTLSGGTAPSTALSTVAGTAGNSAGETITLTVTFDGNVNGLTTGNDSTIFKAAGTGVSAAWSGVAGSTTRTLTYTVQAGHNGQATLDEAALKTALIAGIGDAAGNAFTYTANSGNIANIDASALPVIDTLAPTTPLLALGTGFANGATNAEATAAGGVVTVSAESGASTVVTFSRGGNTVNKTLTGTGAAQAVVLSSADLTTLGDGSISVNAVATDAAGNASSAGSTSS